MKFFRCETVWRIKFREQENAGKPRRARGEPSLRKCKTNYCYKFASKMITYLHLNGRAENGEDIKNEELFSERFIHHSRINFFFYLPGIELNGSRSRVNCNYQIQKSTEFASFLLSNFLRIQYVPNAQWRLKVS